MNQQQQIRVDLKDTEQIKCKECGNNTFEQVVFLHKISALLSPYGQESIYPVLVFQCSKCHTVVDETMLNVE